MNINLMPDEDERQLLKLKDEMTDQQRSDMAEIIQNELRRREGLARKSAQAKLASSKSAVRSSKLSTDLSHEDLSDIYQSTDKDIQKLRVQSLEKKLLEAKKEVLKLGAAGKKLSRKEAKSPIPNNSFSFLTGKLPALSVVVLLIGLGSMRYSKEITAIEDFINNKKPAQSASARASLSDSPLKDTTNVAGVLTNDSRNQFVGDQALDPEPDAVVVSSVSVQPSVSPVERGLLMQLDQRRVELEKRRKILDRKEQEIQQQAQLVGEKVTELKTLINKLSTLRKEKDHKYNARMEQLASVYSAMAPNESASLIAKLDNEVGLSLLERMPGKRMAQILGVMDQNRAIELTKHLTDKKKL